ncbi:YlbF family regulator [Clostridium sp.]|uniref:YlbF family regulator n=1 Tax=Clostridium sp. TaxID=1506 RepID=UPI0034642276
MNIYDKTHELAKVLKDTKEVVDYREAHKKISENQDNKKMVDDFRKLQLEAYNEQMTKGQLSKEITDKMQGLGAILSSNVEVSNYLQSEAKFAVLWEDIIKILHEAIGLDLTFENDNK